MNILLSFGFAILSTGFYFVVLCFIKSLISISLDDLQNLILSKIIKVPVVRMPRARRASKAKGDHRTLLSSNNYYGIRYFVAA